MESARPHAEGEWRRGRATSERGARTLGSDGVKWVTRRGLRVNRAATAWLIRRFIDPDATFLFVEAEDVADVQRRECARGFDAPGATYPHKDEQGRCSFEALVSEHRPHDTALQTLSRSCEVRTFATRWRSLQRRPTYGPSLVDSHW
jgi:hypothetical protein